MINIIKFLDENIKESLGCTEPAAIALAVSAAFNAIKGRLPMDYLKKKLDLAPQKIAEEIKNITVKTDRGVFKNALQVSIAYGLKGINNAAALGVLGDPSKNLAIFDDLNEEKVLEAANLIKQRKVSVIPNYDWGELRIEAEVSTRDGTGIACILKEHSNIALIKVNGEIKFDKLKTEFESDKLAAMQRLSDFVKIIEHGLLNESNGRGAEARIEDAVRTNHKASLIAESRFTELNKKSLGLAIKNVLKEAYAGSDYINLAREKVSLTVEGRMTGFNIRVMTCAGSGNMGIVVTLPFIAMAMSKFVKKYPESNIKWNSAISVMREVTPNDWKKLLRGVGLAHLIANYVSLYSGKLSASCGCGTKAAVGLAAGAAYYLAPVNDRDRLDIIGQAINGVARSIVGMVCDGGKDGCALKTAVATGVAMESALLAFRGLGLSSADGIANKDAMITLQRIGRISQAMEGVDKEIIESIRHQLSGN